LILSITLSCCPVHSRHLDSSPISIQIIFIKWELHDDYFNIEGKRIKFTEVTFSVDYQIQNLGETNITIEFGSTDEQVNLNIITNLENEGLNLTESEQIIGWPLVTNRTYEPGITSRSRDFSFRFNIAGLSQLPKGCYNITPSLEGIIMPEDYQILSYGVVLEMSDEIYSVFYEYNGHFFYYSNYQTSIFFSTIVIGVIIIVQRKKSQR